ncbi:MAG: KH domain-containing protein [Anaerolineales bacterium]
MDDLVEYIAKSLVNEPDKVRVETVRGHNAIILKLYVAPDDKGWVIGRNGRVANATRTLLNVASTIQDKPHVILDIV